MDSTVIGEDMEMQVVVVTHNVLPIRSLRWQNIPSSLPVKCKVYSCGRVKHKRGQQNSSKCLDKRLFYPYIPCVSSPCPPLPSLSSHSFCYPTCEVNFVYGYTIIKKFEREKSYWYHWLIRYFSSVLFFLVQQGLNCVVFHRERVVHAAIRPDSALLWASRNMKQRSIRNPRNNTLNQRQGWRMSQSGGLQHLTLQRYPLPKTLCNYLIQMFGES